MSSPAQFRRYHDDGLQHDERYVRGRLYDVWLADWPPGFSKLGAGRGGALEIRKQELTASFLGDLVKGVVNGAQQQITRDYVHGVFG